MTKVGMSSVGVLVAAMLLSGAVQAQELSEKSVRTFMAYAWSLVPEQFTPPNGKTIVIDKTKKDQVMVPLDTAGEVIHVGRLSAHAQICDLPEDQTKNYRSLMKREQLKKKWTPQQIVFISQLHLTTVMLLTGKIKVTIKDGDKEIEVEPGKKSAAQTCSAEQKKKVQEIIAAYVKTGPSLASAKAPAASTAESKPAASAKAATKQ